MTKEQHSYLVDAMRPADKDSPPYASLTGPLLGCYYPLPFAEEDANRYALNSSRLRKLWCAIYTREEVLETHRVTGTEPIFLPARDLDYETMAVESGLLSVCPEP